MVEGAGRGGVQGQSVLSHAPHPGVDLVGVVAGLVVALAAHRLGQVNAVGRVPADVQLPKGLVGGPPGGVQGVQQVDDLVLHPLEPADGGSELVPRPAVVHRQLVDGLAAADLVGAEYGNRLGFGSLQSIPPTSKFTAKSRLFFFLLDPDEFFVESSSSRNGTDPYTSSEIIDRFLTAGVLEGSTSYPKLAPRSKSEGNMNFCKFFFSLGSLSSGDGGPAAESSADTDPDLEQIDY